MSSIQKRLDELSPYVDAISYGKTPLVQTVMPSKWVVYDNADIKAKALDKTTNGMSPYVFYSESVSIDDILDYVEIIIRINKEQEEKMTLLKIKVEELKGIFTDRSLSELKTLRFVMEEIESEDITDEDLVIFEEPTQITPIVEYIVPTHTPEPKYVIAEPIVSTDKPILEDFKPATCNCANGNVCPECVDY
jgi:hypothetical protein